MNKLSKSKQVQVSNNPFSGFLTWFKSECLLLLEIWYVWKARLVGFCLFDFFWNPVYIGLFRKIKGPFCQKTPFNLFSKTNLSYCIWAWGGLVWSTFNFINAMSKSFSSFQIKCKLVEICSEKDDRLKINIQKCTSGVLDAKIQKFIGRF